MCVFITRLVGVSVYHSIHKHKDRRTGGTVHPSVHPSLDQSVSALHFPQYQPDLFHIYKSYQPTDFRRFVTCIFLKFQNLNFFQVLFTLRHHILASSGCKIWEDVSYWTRFCPVLFQWLIYHVSCSRIRSHKQSTAANQRTHKFAFVGTASLTNEMLKYKCNHLCIHTYMFAWSIHFFSYIYKCIYAYTKSQWWPNIFAFWRVYANKNLSTSKPHLLN